MVMGACPGQIPMPCVPPALMVTTTMVRAYRYITFCRTFGRIISVTSGVSKKDTDEKP